MTYVSRLAACAALLGIVVLGLGPARAQYIPIYVDPPPIKHIWNGINGGNPGAYDYYTGEYNWYAGSEWLYGSMPPDGVDVLFPDSYKGAQPRQLIRAEKQPLSLRSLWFEAGIWYTIYGEKLTLGYKGEKQVDPYLLVVNSQALQNTSEHRLEFERFTIADSGYWKGVGKIENYSEGGLGIGGDGELGSGEINLNNQHIQIGGMGATHFWGQLREGILSIEEIKAGLVPGGIIDVGLFGGVEALQPQPHFILQADNRDWNGRLRVNARGFAIIKADQALGIRGEKRVYNGGSLALRTHLGAALGYMPPKDGTTLQITGAGIIRREGTDRIGALYNDGGRTRFLMPVQFTGDTRFGARGDREGGLWLAGRVYNNGTGDFIKVGPGLISLNNSATGAGANSWTGRTVIHGGVLRINHANALPSTSNIVFESGHNGLSDHGAYASGPSYGGILELGYAGSGAGGAHNFTLGTGPGQLRWEGSGGFSAYGADRSVRLNGGANLNWGATPHFVKSGDALLLGSRYATHNITLTNGIRTGAGVSEIRVERGVGNAHAIITGMLGITANNSGYRKTGRGLLHWNTSIGSFNGTNHRVIIEGGALRLPQWVLANVNLRLAGGVLGIDADFTFMLGSGHGETIWLNGGGGFAAYGGTHKVWFPGGSVWLYYPGELRFGHYTADGTVDFRLNLTLGTGGTRTIRIERGSASVPRADVVLSGTLSGSAPLWLVGDGRIDLTGNNTISEDVFIAGAEVRLNRQGRLASVSKITLGHGGTLYLDDLGTHDSETGGSYRADRIKDDAEIDLQGGTLAYRRSSSSPAPEKVGDIVARAGQNSIQIFPFLAATKGSVPELHATSLQRDASSRGTLHFPEKSSWLRLDTSASGHNVNPAGGVGIMPWATAITTTGGSIGIVGLDFHGFAQAVTQGSVHYVKALDTYHTGAQSTWTNAGLNVQMTANQVLNANRSVNSLILGGGSLNLNGGLLRIHSGGLIASGSGTRIINNSGTITTVGSRPLYVHAFSGLSFMGGAILSLNTDLVKSQSGTLTLGSNTIQRVQNVYIHRGTLDLRAGTLWVGSGGSVGRITVGDGGGNATLKLAPGRWDQIFRNGGGLPSITLNGTPYDPRGPEYGGAQAILQMGGNTKLHIGNLHIQNRGTIDWVGGEASKANILWIDSLSFSGPDAILFMRNWYEYEDIFLVRKVYNGVTFNDAVLPRIIFDGYQNYETTYRQWDKDYWQITPFAHSAVPEPSTWGALLGALGTGLYLLRRRRRGKAATQ